MDPYVKKELDPYVKKKFGTTFIRERKYDNYPKKEDEVSCFSIQNQSYLDVEQKALYIRYNEKSLNKFYFKPILLLLHVHSTC